jgi:hypothetical protein
MFQAQIFPLSTAPEHRRRQRPEVCRERKPGDQSLPLRVPETIDAFDRIGRFPAKSE